MNARREGFTLVEILIVVLLGSIIMGSIYQMVTLQEKTTRAQYASIQTSENSQMALAILSSDLKEVSARDSDIVAADSTYITFRGMRKAGIVCNRLSNNQAYVYVLGQDFANEDSTVVFSDGANAASSTDDAWARGRVSGVAAGAAANCGGVNPLNVASIQLLTFQNTPLANVQNGALLRSFKPNSKYSLVDNGTWGELRRTEGGTEQVLIDQMALVSEGGLRLRYYDSAGVQIPYANLGTSGTRKADVMRIQIKVAAKAATSATSAGTNRLIDSLVSQVYIRGNRRGQ